jgi:hypothetical protein
VRARFFLPQTTERPSFARSPRRGIPLREDRDGRVSVVGPVRVEREPLPFRERLAIGFVLICAIALVMLSRSYGEKVGPAVDEAREQDDAPRGDR